MTLLHILDLLSVFVFALVGARVAADRGLDYGGIALVAIVASVSGGLLRDVLCQLEPVLLHRETIATSSLCGAIAFVALVALNVEASVATIIGGVVVVLVRMLSIQFNLNLPKFKQEQT